MKQFWLKIKGMDYNVLVQAEEESLFEAMEKGDKVVKLERVAKDGSISTIVIRGSEIMAFDEYKEKD